MPIEVTTWDGPDGLKRKNMMATLSQEEIDALLAAIFDEALSRFFDDLPEQVRTHIRREMETLPRDDSSGSEIKALLSVLPQFLKT